MLVECPQRAMSQELGGQQRAPTVTALLELTFCGGDRKWTNTQGNVWSVTWCYELWLKTKYVSGMGVGGCSILYGGSRRSHWYDAISSPWDSEQTNYMDSERKSIPREENRRFRLSMCVNKSRGCIFFQTQVSYLCIQEVLHN